MKELEERILRDGRCLPGGILKVDNFINHQMDSALMFSCSAEFMRLFADVKVDKILTVEASGIAPAVFAGYLMRVPVVFAKKAVPKTMDAAYVTTVHSFTKQRDYTVFVSKEYLREGERVRRARRPLRAGGGESRRIRLSRREGVPGRSRSNREGAPRRARRVPCRHIFAGQRQGRVCAVVAPYCP